MSDSFSPPGQDWPKRHGDSSSSDRDHSPLRSQSFEQSSEARINIDATNQDRSLDNSTSVSSEEGNTMCQYLASRGWRGHSSIRTALSKEANPRSFESEIKVEIILYRVDQVEERLAQAIQAGSAYTTEGIIRIQPNPQDISFRGVADSLDSYLRVASNSVLRYTRNASSSSDQLALGQAVPDSGSTKSYPVVVELVNPELSRLSYPRSLADELRMAENRVEMFREWYQELQQLAQRKRSTQGEDDLRRLRLIRIASKSDTFINARLPSRLRPLDFAVSHELEHVVKFLLEHGAEISFSYTRPSDAYHAKTTQNKKIHNLLLQFGADPTVLYGHDSLGSQVTWLFGIYNDYVQPIHLDLSHILESVRLGVTQVLSWEWNIPIDFSEGMKVLEDALVLTRYSDSTFEACSCGQYLERSLGETGKALIQDLNRCLEARAEQHPTSKRHLKSEALEFVEWSESSTSEDAVRFSIRFKSEALPESKVDIMMALDWLYRAVQDPWSKRDVVGMDLKILSRSNWLVARTALDDFAIKPTGFVGARNDGRMKYELAIHLGPPKNEDLRLQHFLQHDAYYDDSNCWLALFENCVIADMEPYISANLLRIRMEEPKNGGKGLKIRFPLLLQLASVEYPVRVGQGFVFLGYQTALVPTQLGKDYVQFHLEISGYDQARWAKFGAGQSQDQINPYRLATRPTGLDQDFNQFNKMICYLGWCQSADIHLGTANLPLGIEYTGLRERRRTLHWNGISFGAQLQSATPIQAGVTGQANLVWGSNVIRFQPQRSYHLMLGSTAKHLTIVNDVKDRRSWLVPKLSLLLHMCHAWVSWIDEDCAPVQDRIPFVLPHHSGATVAAALRNWGDVVVWGKGPEQLTLRTLLLGLNINLLNSVGANETSTGGNVYGFEFKDIVLEPGIGGFMKKMPIESGGRTWIDLANKVDAVVVCSGIGEVITPAATRPTQRAPHCTSVPPGHNYLAAPLSCLKILNSRNGEDLEAGLGTGYVRLSYQKVWTIFHDPFLDCDHHAQDHSRCWDEKIQQLNSATSLNRNVNEFFKRVKLTVPTRPTRSIEYFPSGAVVFGEQT